MKIIRFGEIGIERTGVELIDGTRVDTSSFGEKYDESFFATLGLNRLKTWLATQKELPKVDGAVRLGCPIERPSKIVCVGLNYKKHAIESGMDLPKEPVIFFKSTSAITGPNDDIMIPRGSHKTDYEVELGVVIGKKASYINQPDAMDYVGGYVLHNDYSERAYQLEHEGQWVKGKSADTFAPLGPYLVTADEIPDPNKLDLWLKVNGQIMQQSNTADMIFHIPRLISYISQYMTLLPGDIISTGTPAGVGMGLKPQRYLKPGDVVELGIEKLGSAVQHLKAHPMGS